MITVISNNKASKSAHASIEDGDLWLPATEFQNLTGANPEHAAPPHRRREHLNVSGVWRQAGRPVVSSAQADVWSLGVSADERRATLESLQAPDFTLKDLNGRNHSLSDYRGKKVFLTTWASW